MSRDEEERTRRGAMWRQKFDETARSFSPTPGTMRAVRSEDPQLVDVLKMTRDLGVEVIKTIGELRTMRRQIWVQHVVGVFLGISVLAGAFVMKSIHDEQVASRERDRAYLGERIETARQELKEESATAADAARRAASSARKAAAESLMAQIEAAEVQARILPPRERPALRAKIEEKKRAAKELGADP